MAKTVIFYLSYPPALIALPPRTQLLFFCLASVQAMTSVLAPLFEPATWPCCLLPKKGGSSSSSSTFSVLITLPWGLGTCPLSSLLAAALAVATAVTWAVMRHADWAWVLQVGDERGAEGPAGRSDGDRYVCVFGGA